VAISDDGLRTYIEWRAQQAIPAVFAIDERGDHRLVDGHVRDGLYVIDAVHRTLVFRLDRQTARASRNRTRSRE
jgi:type IV secretion system protein VirB9